MATRIPINSYYDAKTTQFIQNARTTLSANDISLLADLISDWNASPSLVELFSRWQPVQKQCNNLLNSVLYILCFNVRGLGLRWGEVCLLVKTHKFDIITLGEVGHVDFQLLRGAFLNYSIFYQAGENSHGGVLIMIRNGINTTRTNCTIPNVCVIDLSHYIHLQRKHGNGLTCLH